MSTPSYCRPSWPIARKVTVLWTLMIVLGAGADETQTVRVRESSASATVTQTDSGYQGGASAAYKQEGATSVQAGNAAGGDLGSTELVNGKSVAGGSVGLQASSKAENALGTVTTDVKLGASYDVKVGDNGIEASGQVGLAAELEAVSKNFGVGNKDVGASVQGSATLEAVLGAEAKIGAYIDEKGITIGVEAKAGAYVSAQAELNFEAHIFGVQTNVTVSAEVHAGAMAYGEATVTIGFDGRIKFSLGAGIAFGLGASAGIEFEIDASELMEKYGLNDLAALMEWIDGFVEDPQGTIDQIVNDSVGAAIGQVVDGAVAVVDQAVDGLVNVVESSLDQLGSGIANWFGGGSENTSLPSPEDDEGAGVTPSVTGGSASVDSTRSSASKSAGNCAGAVFERNTKYRDEWSK